MKTATPKRPGLFKPNIVLTIRFELKLLHRVHDAMGYKSNFSYVQNKKEREHKYSFRTKEIARADLRSLLESGFSRKSISMRKEF